MINQLTFKMQANAVLKGRIDAYKPEDFVGTIFTATITAL